MFVHFGLYTLLGENENAVRKGPKAPYAALMKRFNPRRFAAAEWVACARDAGATYLCVTAKHADGFCLWDTQFTTCKVTRTPFKRDILAALAEECARQKIRFCLYYNLNSWLLDYCAGHAISAAQYTAVVLGQLDELVSNYGPVHAMWFDGCDPLFPPASLGQALDLLHRKQPTLVVNDRGLDLNRRDAIGDFVTPERHQPEQVAAGHPFIECCDAIGIHSWGYKRDDAYWSVPELIRRLCRSASYGGNYLLNVSPGGDGTIPPAFRERMQAIGAWLAVNGRSIFGTGESRLMPFDAHAPGLPAIGSSTRRGRKFFLHLLDWPAGDAVLLKQVRAEVQSARLLGSGQRLSVSRQEGRESGPGGGFRPAGQVLTGLPASPPAATPAVLEVMFKADVSDADIQASARKPVQVAREGETVHLRPEGAILKSADGIAWHKVCRYANGRVTIGHIIRKGLECHWPVHFKSAGTYRVIAELGVFEGQKDAAFEISIGREKVRGCSEVTGWYDEPRAFDLGTLRVARGRQTVKFKVLGMSHCFPDIHRLILQIQSSGSWTGESE